MNFANMPNQPNLPPMPQLFGQPAQQMAPAGEIVWVQSVDQLNALTLPPNASRIYMNSADAEFYIVTTDKIGMKSVATYTFLEKPKPQPVEYVTKAEFAELIALLKGVQNESDLPKAESAAASTAGGRPAGHQAKSQ